MKVDVVQVLRDELTERVEKNPRYSMRAFAKSLGLNIGALSGLLSGKRPLTTKAAEKLCDRLGMSPRRKSDVVLSLLQIKNSPEKINHDLNRIKVEEETFRAISDWYHWGILQLVRTEIYLKSSSHSSPKWISRQLKISETEAKLAIDRLLNLGLLNRNKNGFFERTEKNFSTADKNLTSMAHKKWQRQLREKAISSLESDPIEIRSMTSMTMAIDPKKILEAKKLIDEFQENLSEFLEEDKKEKVYQLCISLFPLQEMEN